MNDYNENIDKIINNLTGTKEENINYLNEQMLNISKSENAPVVFEELADKIMNGYNFENRTALQKAVSKYKEDIENDIYNTREFMNKEEYSKAKENIEEIIEKSKLFSYEKENEVKYYFNDSIELLYTIFVNKRREIDKKIKWATVPLALPYNWLSYIAINEEEYDKSIKYCDIGIKYNPMEISLYSEKAESYNRKNEYDKSLKVLDEAYDIIFSRKAMGEYFKCLGHIKSCLEEYETAFACYLVSLYYRFDSLVYRRLGNLRNDIFKDLKYTLTTKEVMDILRKNNIRFKPKKENLELMNNLIHTDRCIKLYPQEIEIIKNEYEFFLADMTPVENFFK